MCARRLTPRHHRVTRGAIGALVALLVAAVLSACGNGTGGSGNSAGSGQTLTFWHYFTDRTGLLDQLAKTYQQQTGVKVNMVLISSGDTLGQKFQAAAQAHTLPDICAAWAPIGDKLAPYAKQGLILNLGSQFAAGDWSHNFTQAEIAASSFPSGNTANVPAGPYLVPLDSNNMQFLYNKKLFAQAAISGPPTTFDEFLADGKKLAAAGITPFVAGLGSWPVDSLAQVYYWNTIGQSELQATFAGSEPYTSQHWVDFLSMFSRLHGAGVLAKGVLADDDPAAESLFVNGQAAMIFDGSWAINVFKQQNPSFTDYGVFFPPTAGQFPVKIPGGVGAEAFVVASSPHAGAAAKFLKWLTDAPQQALYANQSANLPANPAVASHQSLDPNLKTFSAGMNSLIPSLTTSMPAAVDTTMDKGIQQILAGHETPAQVAAAMQKAEQSGQVQ